MMRNNENERRPNPMLQRAGKKIENLLGRARQIVNSIDQDKHQLELMEPRIREIKKVIKKKQSDLEDILEAANKIARMVARLNRGNLRSNVNRFKRRFGRYRNNNNY